MSRVAAWSVALLIAVAGLSACSSTTSTGGGSGCDTAALTSTLDMIMHESEQKVTSIDSMACSGEFAFVRATVSGGGSSAEAAHFIFESNGSEWILKSPELVCGTVAPGQPRPQDAAVPADLWEQACETG